MLLRGVCYNGRQMQWNSPDEFEERARERERERERTSSSSSSSSSSLCSSVTILTLTRGILSVIRCGIFFFSSYAYSYWSLHTLHPSIALGTHLSQHHSHHQQHQESSCFQLQLQMATHSPMRFWSFVLNTDTHFFLLSYTASYALLIRLPLSHVAVVSILLPATPAQSCALLNIYFA